MRRYDDPVEVRRGLVRRGLVSWEGPEQFLWRGRLWKVRDVVAHWVETGPWWQDTEGDLLGEREVWRVEAGRGAMGAVDGGGPGIFDLVFDWTRGSWSLARCLD